MAQGIILIIMALSFVTAVFSSRSLVLEWKKAHRNMYGTMNFDGRMTRGSRMQVLTHTVLCLVSLVLLVSSFMIYQFIHFPVL